MGQRCQGIDLWGVRTKWGKYAAKNIFEQKLGKNEHENAKEKFGQNRKKRGEKV